MQDKEVQIGRVHKHHWAISDTSGWTAAKFPALTHACKLLRSEALKLYFRHNDFVSRGWCSQELLDWLPAHLPKVRSITLEVPSGRACPAQITSISDYSRLHGMKFDRLPESNEGLGRVLVVAQGQMQPAPFPYTTITPEQAEVIWKRTMAERA